MPVYQYPRGVQHGYQRDARRANNMFNLLRVARAQGGNILRIGRASAGLQQRRLRNVNSFSSNATPMPRLPTFSQPTPARTRSRSGSSSSMNSVRFGRPRSMSASAVGSNVGLNGGTQFYRIAPAKVAARRTGATGGFIKSKKTVKKLKKSRKGKQLLAGGATIIRENGAILTRGQHIAYLGHTSTCLADLLKATWMAIFNKLMYRASIGPYTPNTGYSFDANTRIHVTYREAEGILVTETFNPGVTTVTANTFSDWCMNDARPWNANTQSVTRFYFYRCFITQPTTYNPSIKSSCEVDLTNLQVKYTAKSSLKMQNRSKTGTSTDADVVDDVPLYGKTYYGKGQGPYLKNADEFSIKWTADTDNGLIDPGLILYNLSPSLMEPVNPLEFNRVKAYGKVTVTAGQIKTSVLSENKNLSFNGLYAVVNVRRFAASQDAQNCYLGKFRVMALEKIMHVDTTEIVLAYEIQSNMTVSVRETRQKVQSSLVRVEQKV